MQLPDWFQYVMIVPVLSLLMLMHELGHFITARLAGMTVEEFGFGFPPRLIGKKIGDVIYSLNWIPLGAFVLRARSHDSSCSSPGLA
jgi:regulator of sigma E protease